MISNNLAASTNGISNELPSLYVIKREERKNACMEILSVGGSRIYSMKGHLRLRKNLRKSITERSGDLVLLTGREEASGPPFPAR